MTGPWERTEKEGGMVGTRPSERDRVREMKCEWEWQRVSISVAWCVCDVCVFVCV